MYEKIKIIYPELTDEDFSSRGTITIQNDSEKTKVTQKEVNDAIQILKLARKLKKNKDETIDVENTLFKENFI